MKYTNKLKTSNRSDGTQMPFMAMQKKTLSIETVTQSFDIIRIYLPDGINELEEHMDQIEAIRNATEDDIIEVYCIANKGGYVDTIVPLCNALATTPAHTICYVEGHNASAGTFPPMVAQEVHIGPYASFMLHCAQGGSGYGTLVNSAESAKFFEKQYGDLLEDIYYGFITPEEARMLHDGRELYLTGKEIQERLQRRAELMTSEAEEECDCEDCYVCAESVIHKTEVMDDVVPSPEVTPAKKKAPAKRSKKTT